MVSSFLYWHGHKIHVTECGTGDPLLLITGLGGHVGMWDPLLHHFDSHRIIAFDPPGAGDSSVPMMPVPVARLADLCRQYDRRPATPAEARQLFEPSWNRLNVFRTIVSLLVAILLILVYVLR